MRCSHGSPREPPPNPRRGLRCLQVASRAHAGGFRRHLTCVKARCLESPYGEKRRPGKVPVGPPNGGVRKGITRPQTTDNTHTLLRAEGFSCPSCVGKIEKQVGKLDGVDNVKVHFASGRVEVDHDTSKTSVDDLIAAVAKAGYKSKASAF